MLTRRAEKVAMRRSKRSRWHIAIWGNEIKMHCDTKLTSDLTPNRMLSQLRTLPTCTGERNGCSAGYSDMQGGRKPTQCVFWAHTEEASTQTESFFQKKLVVSVKENYFAGFLQTQTEGFYCEALVQETGQNSVWVSISQFYISRDDPVKCKPAWQSLQPPRPGGHVAHKLPMFWNISPIDPVVDVVCKKRIWARQTLINLITFVRFLLRLLDLALSCQKKLRSILCRAQVCHRCWCARTRWSNMKEA